MKSSAVPRLLRALLLPLALCSLAAHAASPANQATGVLPGDWLERAPVEPAGSLAASSPASTSNTFDALSVAQRTQPARLDEAIAGTPPVEKSRLKPEDLAFVASALGAVAFMVRRRRAH